MLQPDNRLKVAASIEELAQSGPLGRGSIYLAIGRGDLVARKEGRRTFILLEDWHRFLASRPVAGIVGQHRVEAA